MREVPNYRQMMIDAKGDETALNEVRKELTEFFHQWAESVGNSDVDQSQLNAELISYEKFRISLLEESA